MRPNQPFKTGLELGIPIGLGYFSVSIAYGMSASLKGFTPGMAALISLSNLTSAGQFAGTDLAARHAPLGMLVLTIAIINARYLLMGVSLSQKLDKSVTFPQRLLIAYGITDEMYAAAISQKGKLTFAFYAGLMVLPVAGWTAGTWCGAAASQLLPADLAGACGIAMYGMFIAILVPKARDSRPVTLCIVLAAFFSWGLHRLGVDAGWSVILVTLAVAAFMAWKHPEAADELD